MIRSSTSHYWIIEHLGRGAFDRWDHDPKTGKWRPFFHWAVLRSDNSIKRFWSKEEADRELQKISKVVPKCYIYEMGGTN